MIFKKLICLLKGHRWLNAGWTSSAYDESIPEQPNGNTALCRIYRCARCEARRPEFVSDGQLKHLWDKTHSGEIYERMDNEYWQVSWWEGRYQYGAAGKTRKEALENALKWKSEGKVIAIKHRLKNGRWSSDDN